VIRIRGERISGFAGPASLNQLAETVHELVRTLPDSEEYELASQIRRAVLSVSSNIAKGGGRRSVREFRQFLRIEYSSTCEVQSQALFAKPSGLAMATWPTSS